MPMSEPIAVGDLVVVVRARSCCHTPSDLGKIYRVIGFHTCFTCSVCKADVEAPVVLIEGNGYLAKETNRVRRIPPLSELEGKRTEEDLREPA